MLVCVWSKEMSWFILASAGLDKIEFLQNHEHQDIYQKAFDIIERYFGTEDEVNQIVPKVDESSQQYQFNAGDDAPVGGFQFWRHNTGTTDELLWMSSGSGNG